GRQPGAAPETVAAVGAAHRRHGDAGLAQDLDVPPRCPLGDAEACGELGGCRARPGLQHLERAQRAGSRAGLHPCRLRRLAAGRSGPRVRVSAPLVTVETPRREERLVATITKSIDVAVPVRTAYNQWTQFEEFPRFMEGVEEVRQLDPTH